MAQRVKRLYPDSMMQLAACRNAFYRTFPCLFGLAALAATPFFAGLAAAQEIDAGSLYKQASPAVVTLEALGEDGKVKKTGSGLLTSADGKLLTNYHVVSNTKNMTVRLANGDAYDIVEVIAIDRRKDIAYLKIPAVDMPFLKLGRSAGVEIGQTVYSIGSPMGLQNTLSHGLVSGIRELDGYRLFQISAPISSGSSGGPVFDRSGAVIGIAVLTMSAGQNLNFAIPIDYARGMLGMTQTQPLSAIYEPEPPSEAGSPSAAKLDDAKMSVAASGAVPAEMRKGAFAFLEKQLGRWKLADAQAVLGSPIRQRDSLSGTQINGTIFAFPDPTNVVREYELNFTKEDVLRAVYAYPPPGSLRMDAIRDLWGRNYKDIKNPNGSHIYVWNDRRLAVVANKDGSVYNFAVYLP